MVVANQIKKTVFPSHPKKLTGIRQQVEAFCLKAGFSKADTKCLVFAVDEACTNIIRHCYEMDFEKEIELRANEFPDRIEIFLRDFGKKVDPKTFVKPKQNPLQPGGLGCEAMEKIMDKVEYNTQLDQGTELRMVRYKNASGGNCEN